MALTAAGVKFLAQAITGQGTFFDSNNAYLGVGSGTTAFDANQTNLTGGNARRKLLDEGYPIVSPPSVTFRATFEQIDANFAWNEWGIFNASTGGVMLNRVVESNVTKQDNQIWTLEVTITFAVDA